MLTPFFPTTCLHIAWCTTFATARWWLCLGIERTRFALLSLLDTFMRRFPCCTVKKRKDKKKKRKKAKVSNRARQAAVLECAGQRGGEHVRKKEDYMHLNGLQLCLMRGVPCWEFSAETVTVSRHDAQQPPDTGSELLTRHSRHRDSDSFAATSWPILDQFFG